GWVEKNRVMVLFRDNGGVPGVAGFILYTVDAGENKGSGLRQNLPDRSAHIFPVQIGGRVSPIGFWSGGLSFCG
ncbi:MAG: hypothetical protein PHF57_08100, partial [Methanoregula sp.]|nr:hypothetical protein [Methanoregula sp.]